MFRYQYILFSGNDIVNQILGVLLSTSMFVGGLMGIVLDNTIPGINTRVSLIHVCPIYIMEVSKSYTESFHLYCNGNSFLSKSLRFLDSFGFLSIAE